MTPQERLYAEEIPTGTFGDAQPPPRPPHRPVRPWSPEEQATHLADLLNGIDGWIWDDEHREDERRHLRLITTQTTTHAA